jgi:hypothetical protein
MSKIYCDIGDVPKGSTRGSMTQCAEKGQIKYYGAKKVDKKILDSVLDKKNSKKGNNDKQLNALKIEMAGQIGKISKLKKELKDEDDDKKYKKLEKEITKQEKEFAKMKEKAIALKKKLDNAKLGRTKTSKRTSRNSKKTSKKQKGGDLSNDNNNGKGNDAVEMWICD